MRAMTWCCVLLLAGLAAGCGGPQKSPLERSFERARRASAEATQQSFAASQSAGPFKLRARYNPSSCDCPQYEVYYEGSWHRVILNAPDALLMELDTLAKGEPPWALSFVGIPGDESVASSPESQRFAYFTLLSFRVP